MSYVENPNFWTLLSQLRQIKSTLGIVDNFNSKTSNYPNGYLQVLAITSGYRSPVDEEEKLLVDMWKAEVLAKNAGEFDPLVLYDLMSGRQK